MSFSDWPCGKRYRGLLLACAVALLGSCAGPASAQATFGFGKVTLLNGSVSVEVVLNTASANVVVGNFATYPGTDSLGASSPPDYTSTNGSVIFDVGVTTQTISVPINNVGGAGKWFTIQVTDPQNSATLVSTVITIGPATPPPSPPPPQPLTVTMNVTSPSPNPLVLAAGAGTSLSVTATATPYNPPTGTFAWSWTYVIEYASAPGNFGPPPGDAGYSFSVDPAAASDPNVSTFSAKATFYKAGYWRVRNIQATAVFTDSGNKSTTAMGMAPNINFVAVSVSILPNPIYVAAGEVSFPTVTLTPSPDLAAFDPSTISYDTTDSTIAAAGGTAKYLTVYGVASGTTQVRAYVGDTIAAVADLRVVAVTYSPQAGPTLTQVVFSMDSGEAAFFSSNTTVQIDAVFIPSDFSPENFSITHSGSKLRFDTAAPNQISLAVGDVFPAGFLSSFNPAILASLDGTVHAVVTLTDGDKQCTKEVTFQISSSGGIGKSIDGVFQAAQDSLPVWQAKSSDDLVGLDASVYLYAQIVRPINDFTASPPTVISAQIRTFTADGTPVSAGVTVQFVLVPGDSSFYTFQSQMPLLLIDNLMFEGVGPEVVAIFSYADCFTQIVRLPQ